jgi:hypothetical protein
VHYLCPYSRPTDRQVHHQIKQENQKDDSTTTNFKIKG